MPSAEQNNMRQCNCLCHTQNQVMSFGFGYDWSPVGQLIWVVIKSSVQHVPRQVQSRYVADQTCHVHEHFACFLVRQSGYRQGLAPSGPRLFGRVWLTLEYRARLIDTVISVIIRAQRGVLWHEIRFGHISNKVCTKRCCYSIWALITTMVTDV